MKKSKWLLWLSNDVQRSVVFARLQKGQFRIDGFFRKGVLGKEGNLKRRLRIRIICVIRNI